MKLLASGHIVGASMALGIAAIALLCGAHTGGGAMAGQIYPLFNGTGGDLTTYGTVELAGGASGTILTVSLQHVAPRSTYAVSECQGDILGHVNCVAALGTGTLTTDATGSGQASFTLPVLAEVDNVKLTNQSGSDYYLAATAANAIPSGNGGIALPAVVFGM